MGIYRNSESAGRATASHPRVMPLGRDGEAGFVWLTACTAACSEAELARPFAWDSTVVQPYPPYSVRSLLGLLACGNSGNLASGMSLWVPLPPLKSRRLAYSRLRRGGSKG